MDGPPRSRVGEGLAFLPAILGTAGLAVLAFQGTLILTRAHSDCYLRDCSPDLFWLLAPFVLLPIVAGYLLSLVASSLGRARPPRWIRFLGSLASCGVTGTQLSMPLLGSADPDAATFFVMSALLTVFATAFGYFLIGLVTRQRERL